MDTTLCSACSGRGSVLYCLGDTPELIERTCDACRGSAQQRDYGYSFPLNKKQQHEQDRKRALALELAIESILKERNEKAERTLKKIQALAKEALEDLALKPIIKE